MMTMYSPLLLAVAAVGAAVPAQDERAVPAERTGTPVQSPDYAFLDDVLGATVVIQPGAEARREAAEENDKVKRPTGEIKDLILENKSGNVDSAVVAFGGVLGIGDKTVALPISLFTWNAADKKFQVAATEDQLKALPAFDVKEARKRGLDNEVVVLRSTWTKLAPSTVEAGVRRDDVKHDEAAATGRKDGDVTTKQGTEQDVAGKRATDQKDQVPTAKGTVFAGTTYVIVPSRYVVASEVDDPPVYAMGEKFGKVSKCILDRNARNLAFCVVSHGGALGVGDTEYLVPHKAMTLCRDGDNVIYCINRTAEQMKAGVKYEKPKHGGVVDLDAAKRATAMQ